MNQEQENELKSGIVKWLKMPSYQDLLDEIDEFGSYGDTYEFTKKNLQRLFVSPKSSEKFQIPELSLVVVPTSNTGDSSCESAVLATSNLRLVKSVSHELAIANIYAKIDNSKDGYFIFAQAEEGLTLFVV